MDSLFVSRASCMAVRASLRADTGRTARLRAEREAAFAAASGVDSVNDMLLRIGIIDEVPGGCEVKSPLRQSLVRTTTSLTMASQLSYA